MATSLPLAKGFFNASGSRPSEDQRRQYIEFAESSIRKVFALSDCHRNSWIPVREKKGVAVFRNFGAARGAQAHKSNIAEVGGKGQVQASLDEVARAYAAHDDALFQRLMKKLNGAVLDAAVVSTIVPRTPLAPYRYIGIKWFAVKTPTPLVSHRDYCCLEVQDKIVDAYGNEMFIRILNSIEIKECPPLENSHGLVRAKMLAGYMYRVDRAEPSVVRIHHVARYEPGGYFPSQWAYKMAESQLVSSVVQIKRVVEKQQMNACTFVDKKQWVPNHERLHCAVCSRQFGTFRPRHHCRCCGEVICGKCSVFKSVDVPGTTLKNVRICSICNMGVQKARPQNGADDDQSQLDDAMSDISTSSVTSSSTIAHNEMNLMDLYLSGPPGTPSAYSTASAQSNLSMRSTASSRSVLDARGHRGNNGGNSTPGTARFFKGGGAGSGRGGNNIFSSSSRVTTPFASANNTPAGSRAPPTGALFNETNTPRSYIGGGLTPSRMAPSHGRGFGPTASAASTPRAAALSGADTSDSEMSSEHERRKSVYKQNPLDLAYLRESVRVKRTDTASSSNNNTVDDDDAMQGTDQTDASTATTETETPNRATAEAPLSNVETVVESSVDTTTTAMELATIAVSIPLLVDEAVASEAAIPAEPRAATDAVAQSTTPRRCRGESSAVLLPPAKMPRLVQDDKDVEMEDAAAASDNQQECESTESVESTVAIVTADVDAAKSMDFEVDEPIRANAHSTSTTESSTGTTAAVQPISTAPETPRKSFLGGLFSRASLESKPAAA